MVNIAQKCGRLVVSGDLSPCERTLDAKKVPAGQAGTS
jgi:hypothetical protein